MRSQWKLKEGWSTYFLVLLLHMFVVWSLSAAEWADGLGLLVWVVLLAVTLGLVFAKVRWLPGFISHIVSTVVGLFWTIFLVSHVLPGALSVKERVLALLMRFGNWLAIALGEGVSGDDVIFVLQIGALLWLISYLAAWFVFRRQEAWPAILPAGIVILINSLYAPSGSAIYFVLFLFCALLLIVRVHVLAEQVRWQEKRISFAPDIALDFLRDGAILSVIIVLAALILPSAFANPRWNEVWDHFSGPWQTMQDEWARLYSSLSAPQQPEAVSFGRTMALGGPVRLSDTPFMVVDAPRALYWRAAIYDQYTGRGWLNSDTQTASWPVGESWPVPVFGYTQEITQTFRPIHSGEVQLFAAGQPHWTSIPVVADLSHIQVQRGESTISGFVVPSVIRATRNISTDEGYQVVSAVSLASAQRLSQAGTSYPLWVMRKYLVLPSTLPARVGELARQVAEGAASPYQAAEAVESYLRREYKYDQSIQAPPLGVDAVDYFLFESKTGYCDYYASAMVVMLRSIGIPARVASGYTSGSWDSIRNGYTVLYSDAHAWVEVFFPNYGWIVFEPTASESLVIRPTDSVQGLIDSDLMPLLPLSQRDEERFGADELLGDEGAGTESLTATGIALKGWTLVAVFAGGLLLLAALGSVLWLALTLRRMKPAERQFTRMVWLSRLAGIRRGASETPREFALRLTGALGGGRDHALFFAHGYNCERFSHEHKAHLDADAVRAHWAVLWRLLLAYQWSRIRAKLTPAPRVERMPVGRL